MELLTPVFRGYAEEVEAILPPELRLNWRKAVAFTHRAKGRKALDHRELLLAMAELDTDETRPPRDLATAVLARFPVAPGAGLEARSHVQLPDGSYPARKDLLDRLTDQYGDERTALLQEIAVARRLTDRTRKRADRIIREGISVPAPGTGRRHDAVFVAKLGALRDTKRIPRVTANQVDQVRNAIRKASKKP
ncbi:hypothetical protein ACFQY5_40920 [Paeniroseomonas aquatica]|uniref:Uncharacterized protein n=1 Tax=Paeniroseomonas aquatica TaxID=373043 RepID=A0ABT8AG18_9PROT|nr:hypothetical protein [Paeniroseomonas aquatica]MDN3568772.1 hypothetical protein [Paeniroseomonas aquatica]